MPNNNGNMIPSFESGLWYTWTPNEKMRPEFSKIGENQHAVLEIKGEHDKKSYGKWCCPVDGIRGGASYSFSIEYLAENIVSELVGVSVILTWLDSDGKTLARDYADKFRQPKEGWKGLSRMLEVHPDACSLKVELAAKWIPGGKVEWRNPLLKEIEPAAHRIIRAATTYYDPKKTRDENTAIMLKAIDEAAEKKADIICFTEAFHIWHEPSMENASETVPGRLTGELSEKARQHRMYVVVDLDEKDDGYYYNTSVLIDRYGEIVGKYRKTHLPLTECEEGKVAEDEYPVFDTDFGKIGIMICWDQWFPEVARILRLKGAEIIFVPTAGYAPIQSQARAMENGVYMVIAGGSNGPMRSRIINPMGEVLGGIYETDEGVYVEEIDLDKKYDTFWLSMGPCLGEGPSIYLKERRPDTYGYFCRNMDEIGDVKRL